MIGVKGLRKSYGHSVVVDDVDLEIPAGGVTSIIGPNGAGKSTRSPSDWPSCDRTTTSPCA